MKKLLLIFLVFTSLYSKSQTACDSIIIHQIYRDPFIDTPLIWIQVEKIASQTYTDPGFILFDDNGDTVANHQLHYTLMPSAESYYALALTNEPAVQEGSTFSGRVEFWSGNYTNLECTWNINEILWPSSGCTEMVMNVFSLNGYGTASWMLLDALQNLIDSANYPLTDFGSASDTLCVPNGAYELIMYTDSAYFPNNGSFTYTFFKSGPSASLYHPSVSNLINALNLEDTLSINLYSNPSTSVHPANSLENKQIDAYPNPAGQFCNLRYSELKKTSSLSVWNYLGERLLNITLPEHSNNHMLDISSFSPGLYLLGIDDSSIRTRLVVTR